MPASDYDEQTKFKAPELAANVTDVPNVGYVAQPVTSTDPLGGRALNFFTDTVEPLLKGAAKIDEITTKEGAQKELEAETEAYRSGSPTNISMLRQRQRGLQEAHEAMSLGPDEDRYIGENRQVFQENVAKIETELNLIANQLENAQNQKVIDPAQAKDRYWSKVSELVNRDPYYAKDIIGIANQNLGLKNLPALWTADSKLLTDAASDMEFIYKDTYKSFIATHPHSSDVFAVHALPNKQEQVALMTLLMDDHNKNQRIDKLIDTEVKAGSHMADETLVSLMQDGGIVNGKYTPSTIDKYINFTLNKVDQDVYTIMYGEEGIAHRSEATKTAEINQVMRNMSGFIDTKFGHLLKGKSEVQKEVRKRFTDALNDRKMLLLGAIDVKNHKEDLENRMAIVQQYGKSLLGVKGAVLETIIDITNAGQSISNTGGDVRKLLNFDAVMSDLHTMLQLLDVANPPQSARQNAASKIGTVTESLLGNPDVWAEMGGDAFAVEEQKRVVGILQKLQEQLERPDNTLDTYYSGGDTSLSGNQEIEEIKWKKSHEEPSNSGKTLAQNTIESTLGKVYMLQDPQFSHVSDTIDQYAIDERHAFFESGVKNSLRYIENSKDEIKKVQGWSRLMHSLSIDGFMSGGLRVDIIAPKGLQGLNPTFVDDFLSSSTEWANYLNQRLLDSDDDILFKLDINQDGTLRVGARKAMVPRFDKKTGKEIPSPFQDTGKKGQMGDPVLVTEEINQVNKFLKVYARLTGQSIENAHRGFYDKYFTEAFGEMLNKNQLDEYTEDTAMAGEDVKLDEIGLASGDLQTKQYLEEQQAEKKSSGPGGFRLAAMRVGERIIDTLIPEAHATSFNSENPGQYLEKDFQSRVNRIQKTYNTAKGEEAKGFKKTANEEIELLLSEKHPHLEQAHRNLEKVFNTLDENLSTVYQKEFGKVGKNYNIPEIFHDLLVVYAAETRFGTYQAVSKKTGKLLGRDDNDNFESKSGAAGHFQVLPNTFKDLVKQGVLGKKYAKALGMTLPALKALAKDDNAIKALLKSGASNEPSVAVILAAAGKLLQTEMAGK